MIPVYVFYSMFGWQRARDQDVGARRMADFWGVPDPVHGLEQDQRDLPGPVNRYLLARELKDTSRSHVWAFLGDDEMDEPEALGAIGSRPARISTTSPLSSTATCSGHIIVVLVDTTDLLHHLYTTCWDTSQRSS